MKNGLFKLCILLKKAVLTLVKGFVYLVGIYLLSWILKVFIGFYHIPSPSMVPTLEVGDWVFAAKMPYVWRSPEYYPLTKNGFPFWNSGTLVEPELDDILLFTNPISHHLHPSDRMSFVKRCVGLPGDTLYVLPSGEVLTKNGVYQPNELQVQGFIKTDSVLLKSEQDEILLNYANSNTWKSDSIHKKKWQVMGSRAKFLRFLPNKLEQHIIPQKGFIIALTKENESYWTELIKRDRTVFEPKKTSGIALDSIITSGNYTFTQNFYFFIGDNMLLASDSRKWQSVPEKLIIGKVLFRFRWNPLKLNRFKWLG